MSTTKLLSVKFLKVKCWQQKFVDGSQLVNLQCSAKTCPHKCAMSFRASSALWNVPSEKLAERLCSLCTELVNLERETVKLNGHGEASYLASEAR